MKYLEKSFSVAVGGEKYAENWERIFGKKQVDAEDSQATVGPEPEAASAHDASRHE